MSKTIRKSNPNGYFSEIRRFLNNADSENIDVVTEFLSNMIVPTREFFDPIDETPSLYTFRASDSYGFSSYPCSSIECRLDKVRELSSLAALYANRIYIINPFEKFLDSHQDGFAIQEFLADLKSLYQLEPFANYGMLGMRNSYLHLCLSDKTKMENLKSEAEEKLEIACSILSDEYKRCQAKVVRHPRNGYYFIRVTGPSDLIDHDAVDLIGSPADKAYEIFGFADIDKDYMVSNILRGFIYSAAHSIVDCEFENFFDGGSFLTSRDVEASVLDLSGGKPNLEASRHLTNAISHDIPYLENISIWKMLEFRELEGEKFENYRDAVNKAIRDYDQKGKDHVEIVNDVINPEIHRIDSIMKRYRETQSKSTKLELGVAFGGLAIGLSGVANPAFSTVLAALGGLSAVKSVGQKIMDLQTPPKEAFDNDYYFLWKMNHTYNR